MSMSPYPGLQGNMHVQPIIGHTGGNRRSIRRPFLTAGRTQRSFLIGRTDRLSVGGHFPAMNGLLVEKWASQNCSLATRGYCR